MKQDYEFYNKIKKVIGQEGRLEISGEGIKSLIELIEDMEVMADEKIIYRTERYIDNRPHVYYSYLGEDEDILTHVEAKKLQVSLKLIEKDLKDEKEKNKKSEKKNDWKMFFLYSLFGAGITSAIFIFFGG